MFLLGPYNSLLISAVIHIVTSKKENIFSRPGQYWQKPFENPIAVSSCSHGQGFVDTGRDHNRPGPWSLRSPEFWLRLLRPLRAWHPSWEKTRILICWLLVPYHMYHTWPQNLPGCCWFVYAANPNSSTAARAAVELGKPTMNRILSHSHRRSRFCRHLGLHCTYSQWRGVFLDTTPNFWL